MSRRLGLLALGLVLVVATLPPAAGAQPPAPLTATIFFKNAPASLTFDPVSPATPITIVVQVVNTSGADVFTTEDFAGSVGELWRRAYFTREDGGISTNTAEATIHGDVRVGFCLSRKGVLQTPTAIPVVPLGLLEGPPNAFSIELTIDDARRFFDLSRPGRYTAQLSFHVLVFQFGGAVIEDCDQFPDTALANVSDAAGLTRQELQIVSNSLEFVVQASADTTAPTTVVTPSPAPNGAGWNRTAVTLGFAATDEAGGSGVNRIEVALSGAQTGTQTLPAAGGAVQVTAEGVTTVAFHAVDNAGNPEAEQSRTVRIDRTAPVLTVPPVVTANATSPAGVVVTYASSISATDTGSGVAALTCTPPSGSVFAIGTTTVTCTAVDRAGNSASASFAITVESAADQINDLIALVRSLNLKKGITDKLVNDLGRALDKLGKPNPRDGCQALDDFVKNVLNANEVSAAQASQLVAGANRVKAVVGCFSAVLRDAADQINDLITLVRGFNLQKRTTDLLVNDLVRALDKLDKPNPREACDALRDFIKDVQQIPAKEISAAQASQLIAGADQVRAVLGCP